MVGTPRGCRSDVPLSDAVEIMWNQQCGILPVLNSEQKVIGVVTDRDLCLTLGTCGRLPGDVTIGEVTSGKLYACQADDDIHEALATMKAKKVRRLPVLDAAGKLAGILSMDDVVLHTETRRPTRSRELTPEEIVDTLKKVYAPAVPEVVGKKAASG
jgi:signal-transduction protein with cAMP-binding, CBS, and nucleotidyltransferase domain